MNLKKTLAMFTSMLLTLSISLPAVSSEEAENRHVADTVAYYLAWKDTYLARDTYVSDETQYYVRYSNKAYQEGGEPVPVTVSEAHGYGMLITACMADYDAEAKEIFDGMYRFFKAHPSEIGPNLMSWQQCDDGKALIDGYYYGSDSASDGDLDIAYALILADKLWGSEGDIAYLSEAKAVINDIMKYEVHKTDWLIQLGDWVWYSDPGTKYYEAARSSDFIMQYFPVFEQVTGDSRWGQVYDSTRNVIMDFFNETGTGLLPDFMVKDSSGKYVPAGPNFLEAETDGNYSYNACRVPWRIGMDYLVGGNAYAKTVTESLNSFIVNQTGGVPSRIRAGYRMNGTASASWQDLCFTAPFLISAKCAGDTQWAESLWSYIVNYGMSVYYGDTVKMLCMISFADLWLVPGSSGEKGDIDSDGTLSAQDIFLLKKHLHNTETLSAKQVSAADGNANGGADSIDLALLKRRLLSQ